LKVRVIQKHKTPASVRHLIPGGFVLLLFTLPVFGLLWRVALWAWLAMAGAYSVCNIVASVVTARKTGNELLPVLPAVFACYHIAYGYGFLRGICDFVLLRRKARQSYANLTRGPESAATHESRRVKEI
jgi:hypothetical protein